MTTAIAVKDFMSQPALAIVGASRSPNKFGSIVYKDLKSKGYTVFAVNPHAQTIEGDPAYPDLMHLPQQVGGVVLIVPPAQTEQMVRQAAEVGITRVWIQPGAESTAAVAFCEAHGISVILGECIMMYAGPVKFPHNFHKLINRLVGKQPK